MFGKLKSVLRFSLLLLEEQEDYLQEFVVECHWPLEIEGNWSGKPVLSGTLRLCTKSLFFEPDDVRTPVVRFPFRRIQHLEPMARKSFTITTNGLTKMKANNADQPYIHLKNVESHWKFSLLYAVFDRFLQMVTEQMALKDNEELLQKKMQERVDGASFDTSRLVDFSETIGREASVSHVQPLVREPGKLIITNSRIYYQPLTSVTGFNLVRTHPLNSIAAVVRRRSSLRPCGLEIFFLPTSNDHAGWDSPCAFFEFRSFEEREQILQFISEKIHPSHIPGGILESQGEWMERVCNAWQRGRISNFDYILYLNLASGRTFNDLRQWPIFPWVLKDYTSPVLDLDNPGSYRDLSKPVGALNPERLETFRRRFREMPKDGFPPPFLYGTHYSTPGYVMFWLVRAAPAHILQLQSGKFDAPDRMFYSIAEAWKSVTTNPADVKELTPEFFLPNTDFLVNRFHLALGKRQNGKPVDDVELPSWAKDPFDFLSKNRAALESTYVSEHLHEWIDLIFGCHQCGEAAIEADNVFYYLSYEGAVEIESVEDPIERKGLEAQINEFGQTPKQIFKHPHPPRKILPSTPDPNTIFETYTMTLQNEENGKNLVIDLEQTDNQALTLALISMVTNVANSNETNFECIPDPVPIPIKSEIEIPPSVIQQANQTQPKRETIYDRVKQQWGFQSESMHVRRTSKELRRTVTDTMRGINSRITTFVDQFNSVLMPHPSARRISFDISDIWGPSLFHMELKHEAKFLQGSVRSMAISNLDGGVLYCAGDNATLKMFSLENGEQIRSARIERQTGKGIPLSDLDLLPNLKPNMQPTALIGSLDNCVYAYSVEFGRLVGFFNAHDDAVSVVKFLGNQKRYNRLMTASWDGSVKIWQLQEGRAPWETVSSQPVVPEIDISEHDSAILKVAASKDGSLILSGTKDGITTSWDLRAPSNPLWKLRQSEAPVSGVSFFPNGEHVLCGYEDGCLKLWSMKKPKEIITSAQCISSVHECLTDGLVSLHGQDQGQIALWNVGRYLGNEGVLDHPLPDGSGFFPSLQCSDLASIQALCTRSIQTLEGNVVLWIAAGQENGNISLFKSL